MSYDYSENILVQESAGNLLRDELGWMYSLPITQKHWAKMGHLEGQATMKFSFFVILRKL